MSSFYADIIDPKSSSLNSFKKRKLSANITQSTDLHQISLYYISLNKWFLLRHGIDNFIANTNIPTINPYAIDTFLPLTYSSTLAIQLLNDFNTILRIAHNIITEENIENFLVLSNEAQLWNEISKNRVFGTPQALYDFWYNEYLPFRFRKTFQIFPTLKVLDVNQLASLLINSPAIFEIIVQLDESLETILKQQKTTIKKTYQHLPNQKLINIAFSQIVNAYLTN